MKQIALLFFIVILLTLGAACKNQANKKSPTQKEKAENASADADSVVQSFSGTRLVKEVPYKNGKRQGLMKTFDASGLLYQSFWYENGKRQDTAKWYFSDGRVFRKTPFKDDSAHGIQIQYYRNGVVRAKLEFKNGVRTPYLEEFESNGKKVGGYPDLVIKTIDEYNQTGKFKIILELSGKNNKANFYRGEFTDGLFTPKKYLQVNNSETTGYVELKKSTTTGVTFVGIIAEIPTTLGNKYLVYKKISIPYTNLE
jgi:antitoxin component YwqK of YwqJK toxin-antitoxin module